MARILDTFPDPLKDAPGSGSIVLAGGCFWCTEGVFRQVPGVTDVISGYAGGDKSSASYRLVCEGDTGHAEVIDVKYDPAKVSLGQILKVFFWLAHDPTQKNGQGHDIGTQYRSAIFYQNDEQKALAQEYINQINDARLFDAPIATALEPLTAFYPAEDYHQNYAALNPSQGYIQAVAQPKINKTRSIFNQ